MWLRSYPDPFLKKSQMSISLDQQSEMLYSLFLLHVQVEVYQYLLELRCYYLFLPYIKFFCKTKGGLKLVFIPYFLHYF